VSEVRVTFEMVTQGIVIQRRVTQWGGNKWGWYEK